MTETAVTETTAVREMIRLEGVSKRYPGQDAPAVEDLTLGVRDGEIVVLLGPSGCGKSTLLKMTAGLEDVSDGEIYIDGRLVNYVRPADRDVAMVFQRPNPFPKSIYDNIAWGPRVLGMKKDLDDRVEHALKQEAIWDEVKHRLKRSARSTSSPSSWRPASVRSSSSWKVTRSATSRSAP